VVVAEVIPVVVPALPAPLPTVELEGPEVDQAPALVVLTHLIIQTQGRDLPVVRAMQLRVAVVAGAVVEK